MVSKTALFAVGSVGAVMAGTVFAAVSGRGPLITATGLLAAPAASQNNPSGLSVSGFAGDSAGRPAPDQAQFILAQLGGTPTDAAPSSGDGTTPAPGPMTVAQLVAKLEADLNAAPAGSTQDELNAIVTADLAASGLSTADQLAALSQAQTNLAGKTTFVAALNAAGVVIKDLAANNPNATGDGFSPFSSPLSSSGGPPNSGLTQGKGPEVVVTADGTVAEGQTVLPQ